MNTSILIVDDEEDILDLLDYTLSSDGYDTITCINTQNGDILEGLERKVKRTTFKPFAVKAIFFVKLSTTYT